MADEVYMNLLECAERKDLSPAVKYTVEMLIDFVAWRFDDHNYDESYARDEQRQQPDYAPRFEMDQLRRAYPHLKDLTWLSLQDEHPKVVDLEPLTYLTNLKGLSLGENAVTDISPISKLTKLEKLFLDDNPISDLGALRPLKRLRELSICGVPAADLSVLASLPKLNQLRVSASLMEPFMQCERLSALVNLRCGEVDVDNFIAFPDMPNLRSLSIDGVHSLEGIQKFPRLCDLGNIWGTFEDLAPLESLVELTHVHILKSSVQSLKPLKKLVRLRFLVVKSDSVEDLSPLYALPALHHVFVESENVSESAIEELRSTLSSWDVEFKAAQPTATPEISLEIVEQRSFDYYDEHPFGLDRWDGNEGMMCSEANWLDAKLRETLDRQFEADEDFDIPFKAPVSRSLTVCLYSDRAVRKFKKIALDIQSVLCWAKNEWIIYLQSDLCDSKTYPDDFVCWVYRDKMVAAEKDAPLIKGLIA